MLFKLAIMAFKKWRCDFLPRLLNERPFTAKATRNRTGRYPPDSVIKVDVDTRPGGYPPSATSKKACSQELRSSF